ncbi:MAG: tetratricopeptide repeat protein [Acidobacteria bacterium]|nr:tetratricopeptide repeat protein [Acidobacteriota bacterium]
MSRSKHPSDHRRQSRSFDLVLVAALVVGAAGMLAPAPPEGAPTTAEVLAGEGLHVTGGAAPGYVEDRACSQCHRDLYRSYQSVGMARSFYRPTPERQVEDFSLLPFHHEASDRYYELERVGEHLVFRRYQLDDRGRRIFEVEQEVDWVLGSGNHARTYLYRTAAGELFQLPLAWYSNPGRWGMAPGYDRQRHPGILRVVVRECMACHNAYPDVPVGSDLEGEPSLYPEDLPEGIGCQRCHGPGAQHTRLALEGEADGAALRASIVNPGRLEPQRRDDVCNRCHLQPSVAIPGIQRFGAGDYSFEPGQDLAAHRVELDVVDSTLGDEDAFEINHHPYRLRQSRCYLESGGALSCLTCHDPHRTVAATQRAEHFRKACLTCHELSDCDLDEMTAATAGAAGVDLSIDPGDCVSCHMPKRRTQDVVQVVMTDHKIQRRPGGPELLAPRQEREPVLEDLVFLEPQRAPPGDQGEVYRAAAVLKLAPQTAAMEHLEKVLARSPAESLEPYLELARAQLGKDRLVAAETTLRAVLARVPDHPDATANLAVAVARQGRIDEGIELLRRALEIDPVEPESHFNLARLLEARGRREEAETELRRALEHRPNFPRAWHRLGLLEVASGRREEGLRDIRWALSLDPVLVPAALDLGRLLVAAGDREAAVTLWRRSLADAPESVELEQALAGLERGGTQSEAGGDR